MHWNAQLPSVRVLCIFHSRTDLSWMISIEGIYPSISLMYIIDLTGMVEMNFIFVDLQKAGRIAAEIVFPESKMYQDHASRDRTENYYALDSLKYGTVYRGLIGPVQFYSGSRSEVLFIRDGELTDFDIMRLCGGALGVHMPQGDEQPPAGVALVCRAEGCPPGYTRVEVVNVIPLANFMTTHCRYTHNLRNMSPNEAAWGCVTYTLGSRRRWLHCDRLFECVEGGARKGPSNISFMFMDSVLTLVCSGPHPDMKKFFRRPRSPYWPSTKTLEFFRQLPALLVLVGPKGSIDAHLYCRFTFSHFEFLLFSCMPSWAKRAHVMFKCTFRRLLRKLRGYNEPSYGRSKVGSYHLKTVLLHVLEENPPVQQKEPFKFMLTLFCRLRIFIQQGILPHYFLPKCNLLATVDSTERQFALRAVRVALDDPIKGLLSISTTLPLLCGFLCGPDLLTQGLRKLDKGMYDVKFRSILFELDNWRIQQRSYAIEWEPKPVSLMKLLDYWT